MRGVYEIFVFLAAAVFLNAAHAQGVWHEDLIVEDVSFYIKDSKIIQIKFENFPNNTGCAPADAHGIVYINTGQVFDPNWHLQYSTFLSAQAQGVPVDVYVDSAVCNTASGFYDFGPPAGLGLKFYGVRLDGGS